jgi:hypothetical protein
MTAYKTSIKEVFSDDTNSPFWQRLRASPDYIKFEEDLAHIAGQSLKHNMPYNQTPEDNIGVEE